MEEPEKEGSEARVPQPGPHDVPGDHHEAEHGEDDNDQGVEEATHAVPVISLLHNSDVRESYEYIQKPACGEQSFTRQIIVAG